MKPYKPTAEEVALDARVAKETEEDLWAQRQASWTASVPVLFRDAVSTHPIVLERLARIKSGQRGGLLATGHYGRGKTWNAYALANAVVRDRLLMPRQIIHGPEADLFSPIGFASFGDQEPLVQRFLTPRTRMILLDDVGRGAYPGNVVTRNDFRTTLFERVFDAAWRDNKYLVLTTNMDPDQLKDYIGEAAADRMSDLIGSSQLVMTGENMRADLRLQREAEWAATWKAAFPNPLALEGPLS